jgi:RNA polymerase sigma factor (sigma-70 family)
MGLGRMGMVVNQFQRLYSGGSVVGLGEWELLRRYLDRGDEDAFRAIVSRHGPMVMAVCRRVLGEARDVEDAFQVTFLILAQKAGKLSQGDSVGHWLYGVAYRVALRARTASARRQARERAVPSPEVTSGDDPSGFELGVVIDEELVKLPRKYRAPVVLCYLEGLTHEEAAEQLDWPIGTVKGRLSRARDLLKGRLSRRGLAPESLASVVGLLQGSRAVVSPSLIERTAKAALEIAAGRATGMVSASAAALLEEGVRTMFFHKLKLGIAILMVLGTGAVVVAYQGTKKPVEAVKLAPNGPDPAQQLLSPPIPKNFFAGPIAEWPILVDKTPKTKAILEKLEVPISMNFLQETPLEDVKKYIEQATQDEAAGFPNGIPIYIDPIGLQEAEKTMASTVSLTLEGIPLKTTLRVILKQLGLTYTVKDGLLTITSLDSEDMPTAFGSLIEKSEQGELTKEQYKELIEILKLRNEVRKLEELKSPQ